MTLLHLIPVQNDSDVTLINIRLCAVLYGCLSFLFVIDLTSITFAQLRKANRMLNKRCSQLSNQIQDILEDHAIDRISVAELIDELSNRNSETLTNHPTLDLQRLLRLKKILGGFNEAGKWYIQRIIGYKSICSITDVQELSGFESKQPIQSRIGTELQTHNWPEYGVEDRYFICQEVKDWVKNTLNLRDNGMAAGTSPSNLSRRLPMKNDVHSSLQRIRAELPAHLHEDYKLIENAIQKDTDSTERFIIPEARNRISENDLSKGRLRITRGLKKHFPTHDAVLHIEFADMTYPVQFRMRDHGDRARSHILQLGRELTSRFDLSNNPSIIVERRSRTYYIFHIGESALEDQQPKFSSLETPKVEELTLVNPEHLGSPFQLVGTLGELFTNGLPNMDALRACGIYRILVPDGYSHSFIKPSDTIENGNVINPWPIGRLSAKWVPNTRLVYLGLAGARSSRSLRKRLNDLIRHGCGKTTDRGPHRGGEILWQLANYESFILEVIPTGDPPVPRQLERNLLAAFVRNHGQLPFSNRQL
jgi:hypothetical protein